MSENNPKFIESWSTHDSSAHAEQAETREGFYLSEDGEWVPDGWEPFRFNDLLSAKGGKRLPKGENLIESVTQHPYIRIADLENNRISDKGLKYLSAIRFYYHQELEFEEDILSYVCFLLIFPLSVSTKSGNTKIVFGNS